MADRLRQARHEIGIASLRTLLGIARFVPLRLHRFGGRLVGRLALLVSRSERRRAVAHVAASFPELTASAHGKLVAACARHLGTTLGEVAWLWSARASAILQRSELDGLEHLTSPLTPTSGAILVTGHCGNWEWLNLGLGAAGVPMTAVAREVFDPRLDEVARRLRGRLGGETVLRGQGAGGKIVKALASGRVIGMLIDQDIDVPGAFVDFFGRPAWTPTGAAQLALRTGAPIVTGFATRRKDGVMKLAFDPPIRASASSDPETDIARLTALLTRRIERQVRSAPEQWVWMHRRWKRQPGPADTVWHGDEVDAADPQQRSPVPLG